MYNQSNILIHYGKKGMKWGRRSKVYKPAQSMSRSDMNKRGLIANDKKEFKKDVKLAMRNGGHLNAKTSVTTNDKNQVIANTKFYDHKNKEVNREYAMQVSFQALKKKQIRELVSGTLVTTGAIAAAYALS